MGKDINSPDDLQSKAEQAVTPSELMNEVEYHLREDVRQDNPEREKTGTELLKNKVESIPCLLDPILPKVGLGALAGPSDSGKSMLLRQLVIWVVLGGPKFGPWGLNTQHRSALVVCTEDDERAISYLLHKQAGDLNPDNLAKLRFKFDFENLVSEIDESLTANPVDLVVIDCFSDAYGGDLKDTQKIRLYLNHYHRLAEKHKCLFLFLHHTGKRTENFEPSKNNLLSGQGFEAKMRVVIEFRPDTLNPAMRHLCIVKGNYLSAEHKRESYEFEFDNNTFTFDFTGKRTPFEMLSKNPDDAGRAKFDEAAAMKNEGKTLDEIAISLGYANRGSVSKLLKKHGYNLKKEDDIS